MGKRMPKRSTVDLYEDDEEEDQTRQYSCWTCDEEILLCQCWVEVSENSDIGANRNDDSVNGDCQKFNAIYKHLERKSEENKADHIETAKINFAAQSKGRKFFLEHAQISSAYEAKKEKELAYTECKDLEFLMIDPNSLPEPKSTIIRRKQEKIMAQYNEQ
ncbi:hypothetical protein Tco_0044860 [Tanacetum coccineum]